MPAPMRMSDGAFNLSQLFGNAYDRLFVIHPAQRRFKWGAGEVKQLWTDLSKAHDDGRDSYFLGTVLVVPGDGNEVSVIDGQQRITALSLLVAVLRDACSGYPDLYNRSLHLQSLISQVDSDGKPGALILRLQESDNAEYIKCAKDHGSTGNLKNMKGRLSQATRTFSEQVRRYLNVPSPEGRLRSFCTYIEEQAQLLVIELQNESQGYLVFDTTNTRGLKLSPAEALKGRLATTARENSDLSDKLISQWNAAARDLENAGLSIDAMDNYLHVIWSSRQGHTPKRSLDRIADRISKDELSAFLTDIETYKSSYLRVASPNNESSWLLVEDLKDLNYLNRQSNGFLTMVQQHAPSQFSKAVNLVLSLQIRNITVSAKEQANAYEKLWPGWSKQVREGDVDEVFASIRSYIIDDKAFTDAFAQATVASSNITRHLLRRLDPITRPGSGVFPMEVEVEHILPKSVLDKLTGSKRLTSNVKAWLEDLGVVNVEEFDKEAWGNNIRLHLHRLGNQALFNDKKNRGAKDLPFAKKKLFYQEQALKLTNDLAAKDTWGFKQIQERQAELAKDAPSVW